jgi:hypothetical protein
VPRLAKRQALVPEAVVQALVQALLLRVALALVLALLRASRSPRLSRWPSQQ